MWYHLNYTKWFYYFKGSLHVNNTIAHYNSFMGVYIQITQ